MFWAIKHVPKFFKDSSMFQNYYNEIKLEISTRKNTEKSPNIVNEKMSHRPIRNQI